MPARTKLAQLIAREEGFGKPGAIPTLRHNPGDLRHSPHSEHPAAEPDAIGSIDTDDDGWNDLERQLQLYADRGLTLRTMVDAYAPPGENDTSRYLEFLTTALGLPADSLVSEALTMSAS